MDYLAASGLEPQLAIPVIVVVVGALLVYVFGFQKSEEPSLEHLAVLQSTSSYKARSVSNVKHKNNIVSSKPREKPLQQNGVGGHGHDNKNRAGGDAAQKKKDVSTKENKENKPPTTPKSQTASKKVKQEKVIRPEDFDSGEWIQATSRKDKKKQVKPKDEPKENLAIPSSPKKTSESNKQSPQKDKDDAISKTSAEDATESVLKEAQIQVQSQTTQTTPKATPEKKAGKKGGAKDVSTSTTTTGSSSGSSQESTPAKKQNKPQQQETKTSKPAASETSAPEVVAIVNGVAEPPKQEQSSPAKKQSISEDAPPASSTEPKGHVAFDELGDTTDAWEEAKSRGNKKRRARKD